MVYPIYQPLGDQGVLISYEEKIDPLINERVRSLSESLTEKGFPWLEDLVFSYRSLLVLYDSHRIRYGDVVETVKTIEHSLLPTASRPSPVYEIPAVYGGPYGPDLNRVADHRGLAPDQVINIFSNTVFTIYFLGFLGAQPYLGGLPSNLEVPRLDSPRLHMPAGSIGIGGVQASLITIDQPSGHNFIGRTFLSLYDPSKVPPTNLRAGDRIVFPRVSQEEAETLRGRSPERKRRGVQA